MTVDDTSILHFPLLQKFATWGQVCVVFLCHAEKAKLFPFSWSLTIAFDLSWPGPESCF